MNSFKSLLLLTLGMALLVVLAACAAGTTPAPTTPPAALPTSAPLDAAQPTLPAGEEPQPTQPPAVIEEGSSADGAALIQARCSECHNVSRVKRASGTREQWEVVVNEMIAKGAVLNEEEKATLLDYLVENYGK